jgi:hypothetical protein
LNPRDVMRKPCKTPKKSTTAGNPLETWHFDRGKPRCLTPTRRQIRVLTRKPYTP